MLTTIISTIYPLHMTATAIQNNNTTTEHWLMYWVIYIIYNYIQVISYIGKNIIPYYTTIELIALFILTQENLGITKYIYQNVLSPFLTKIQIVKCCEHFGSLLFNIIYLVKQDPKIIKEKTIKWKKIIEKIFNKLKIDENIKNIWYTGFLTLKPIMKISSFIKDIIDIITETIHEEDENNKEN